MKPKTKRKRAPKTAPLPELPERPSPESFQGWSSSMSERERRIDQITDRMMQGAWLTGVSDKSFAEQWGMSPNTVRKMAAEASRMVRFRIRLDPEAQADARAQLIQLFQVIGAKAMGMGDAQGLRVALDAARAFGFYMGIEPAKRLEVETNANPFDGWTTEEKLAYAREGRRPRRAVRQLAALPAEAQAEERDDSTDRMH